MARIRIDYSDLVDAAKKAGQAADEMENYASSISSRVEGPIGSLPGGASNYTNSIADLARQKAQSLRTKAGKYKTFEGNASSLVETAKAADKEVEVYIGRLKSSDSQNLTWCQKIGAALYDLYSSTIGTTEFGRAINMMANSAAFIAELRITALKKARDVFVYGKGRYVLNIVLTVAAAVAAVSAIFNPLAWPFAIAAVVAAVVKVAASGLTISDNIKALFVETDDPGAARYYGNTSSLENFAKKHFHNKTVQNLFKGVDTVGAIADAVAQMGNLLTASRTMQVANPDGSLSTIKVSEFKPSMATVKENLLKKIGVSSSPTIDSKTGNPVMQYKFSGSDLLGNVFGYKKTELGNNTTRYVNGAKIPNAIGVIDDTAKMTKNIGIVPSEIIKISDLSSYGGGGTSKIFKHILKRVPIINDYVGPFSALAR